TQTVEPAALDHLVLAPSAPSVAAGESVTYTATGADQYGNSRGAVTATYTIDGVDCSGPGQDECTATTTGDHAIVGTFEGKTGPATQTVVPADLDHLVLAPASSTVAAGEAVTYTATGFDEYGNSRGPVTATYTIDGDDCSGVGQDECTATATGDH